MKSSLIDAKPIIALFERSDQHPSRILSFCGSTMGTWPVLTEVSYMLDFSKETQLDFTDWIRAGVIEVHNLEQWQLGGIREKMRNILTSLLILQMQAYWK